MATPETEAQLEDDEGDLEEFVNELDQQPLDVVPNHVQRQDEDVTTEDEDWIEVETLDKLAEIERQLGLAPRLPVDEQEEDAHGTVG
jgi:hypothetical protein